jgi:hypothetical protein
MHLTCILIYRGPRDDVGFNMGSVAMLCEARLQSREHKGERGDTRRVITRCQARGAGRCDNTKRGDATTGKDKMWHMEDGDAVSSRRVDNRKNRPKDAMLTMSASGNMAPETNSRWKAVTKTHFGLILIYDLTTCCPSRGPFIPISESNVKGQTTMWLESHLGTLTKV